MHDRIKRGQVRVKDVIGDRSTRPPAVTEEVAPNQPENTAPRQPRGRAREPRQADRQDPATPSKELERRVEHEDLEEKPRTRPPRRGAPARVPARQTTPRGMLRRDRGHEPLPRPIDGIVEELNQLVGRVDPGRSPRPARVRAPSRHEPGRAAHPVQGRAPVRGRGVQAVPSAGPAPLRAARDRAARMRWRPSASARSSRRRELDAESLLELHDAP